MKRLTILGSTGSIGTNTLSVVRQNPEKFQIVALVAGKMSLKWRNSALSLIRNMSQWRMNYQQKP